MNPSSISIRNNISSMISSIQRNNFKLNFTQTKNFLTLHKQINKKSNFLSVGLKRENIILLKNLSKSNYCEKIGNLVLLNSKNEIMISFEEKTYSVFFNKLDPINVVNEKIIGINEKIQAVEFIEFESKEVLSEETKNITLMKDFIKNPFIIRINKYLSLNYIPGMFPQLYNETEFVGNLQTSNPDYLKSAEDIKNVILLKLYDIRENNSAKINIYENQKTEYLSAIISKLDHREKFLKSLFDKQVLSEKMVNEKLVFISKMAIRLGMLFAISHFSVFYALIYKIYAWDVIEPITYIVGNVYWIITLSFLAFKNIKLDFNLFHYNSIREIYFKKYAKQLNYDQEEKVKLQEELEAIQLLRLGLADI